MNLEYVISCPICGGNSFEDYLKTKDFTTTQEEFTIQKCRSCKFVFTNPRPDSNTIGRYYNSDNYISHSGKSSLFGSIYLIARKFTLKSKHKLVSRFQSSEKVILDYGCGTGDFLFYMKQRNWTVCGVEPSENARNKAKESLQNIVYQSINEINHKNFDIITLWHVLEHVHELNDTIQKLKILLRENGTLIIAVPNYSSYDGSYYKSNWAGYDVPRHLWHFSRETMNQLMNKNEMLVKEIIPMKLDSFYVSLLSEQYQNESVNKIMLGVKAFIRGMISNLKARQTSEFSSLIYIIKKR